MTDPRARLVSADDLTSSADLAVARGIVAAMAQEAGQAAMGERMLEFLDGHPDALLRTCTLGHLTGSAFVVDADARHALLMFHTKLQRWLQPGGHADGDANLARVALREASEETGIDGLAVDPTPIDLDIHRVAPPSERPHLHHDVRYLVVAPVGATPRGNHESEALRWVSEADLPALGVDEGTLRMAGRGFQRARDLLAL
jgi:8-oxo-dGTP pyrophosphatase MutT (NUDIX family)